MSTGGKRDCKGVGKVCTGMSVGGGKGNMQAGGRRRRGRGFWVFSDQSPPKSGTGPPQESFLVVQQMAMMMTTFLQLDPVRGKYLIAVGKVTIATVMLGLCVCVGE